MSCIKKAEEPKLSACCWSWQYRDVEERLHKSYGEIRQLDTSILYLIVSVSIEETKETVWKQTEARKSLGYEVLAYLAY